MNDVSVHLGRQRGGEGVVDGRSSIIGRSLSPYLVVSVQVLEFQTFAKQKKDTAPGLNQGMHA